jgi:hypothetical protein
MSLLARESRRRRLGIFASERYLATHRPLRSLDDMQDHDIIGHTSDFSGFQSERRGQLPLFTQFSAAAAKRSVLRVTPLANHFAAAAHDLGLAFLAVPFALAEGLVRVLPQENATLDVWLLRRKESDLRKLTKEVRRFLEGEFANSRNYGRQAAGSHKGGPCCFAEPQPPLYVSSHRSRSNRGRNAQACQERRAACTCRKSFMLILRLTRHVVRASSRRGPAKLSRCIGGDHAGAASAGVEAAPTLNLRR